MLRSVLALGAAILGPLSAQDPWLRLDGGAGRPSFGGVYPHLASFNDQNECGTGAVVPWGDRLYWITYAPHRPRGSDDRLYAMDGARNLFAFRDSVGGTPANRLIHRETQQLFLGPYVIDKSGAVRVLGPDVMPGRLTGTSRHPERGANAVVFATMEEGFYEVDVRSLAVRELHRDANSLEDKGGPLLPGYHGKGLYSGQGRLVYANNGENSAAARRRPDVPSGCLAEWIDGQWRVVQRNQFTEVSGPGGIEGNAQDSDPIWSIGWDHRSLILMLLDSGSGSGSQWHRFRLPKASHCYDGAHGWNTEWPRIREIGEGDDLLMTMHGAFWRFPKGFRAGATQGIRQRSSYLKVIGDFTRHGDHVVFGCDDAARAEFLNTRRAKGKVAGPANSQSNLWFVAPERLDALGPRIGRGAVWLDDPVEAGAPSDPYLVAGFDRGGVHLVHDQDRDVKFVFEESTGDGRWRPFWDVTVGEEGYRWLGLPRVRDGVWVRVVVDENCRATAWFEHRGRDGRDVGQRRAEFAGLAPAGGAAVGGLLRAGAAKTGLQVLANGLADGRSEVQGYYELTPELRLERRVDATRAAWMAEKVAIPKSVLTVDGNSILYVADNGSRYRLPLGNPVYRERPELLDLQRTAREVVTERDLFQAAGTFFELPARNAGGFGRIRSITTHGAFVQDYASWRGLMVLTGIRPAADHERIVWSEDRKAAVWLGTIDDLWRLGKPSGSGGPWTKTKVVANVPSDPFLMAGFDKKSLRVSHDGETPLPVHIEVDITGTGHWQRFETLDVAPGAGPFPAYSFPRGFEAYWVRLVAKRGAVVTATFEYR
eukprot:jgi/Undpi1/11740/HiC_scaffold_37.g14035.m1